MLTDEWMAGQLDGKLDLYTLTTISKAGKTKNNHTENPNQHAQPLRPTFSLQ